MAAAAYKVTLIVAQGAPNGPRVPYSMTASDVAAAQWLFASGQGSNVLSGSNDCYIVDAILSAAGTDTTQSEFFIGGVSTGFKLQNATSLATTITRPFQLAPLKVPKGLALQVNQLA